MKTSLLLVVLLLASCTLAAPMGDLEASGLGPEEAAEELTVFEEDDTESNLATGDAAFASNFGSDSQGSVSGSFSATASVSVLQTLSICVLYSEIKFAA